MTFLSIEDQLSGMRARWPQLRGRKLDPRSAVWRGLLRPSFQDFLVRVAYQVPLTPETFDPLRDQPVVTVIRPRLLRREGNEEGPLPHVYGALRPRPELCLFDPETDEWTPAMPLAETTVPWTVDWLTFYEFWTVTGIWSGGGRHPTGDEDTRRAMR
ncbi:hypothetical protein [Antarcticirhabdus aurantiaca]|uniref:Uncharacterized protein n=1 Tax=Antarcticirhabdus aurantiaca TaxID=2606717 RepID=A0ACD4NWZ6_9HYPH|nr:hypothetical protein [Antarcticirhabdus aurantiaca]WAJ31224.1 hypothetical protein OXU80_13910 [Jeongeuplla avenae]